VAKPKNIKIRTHLKTASKVQEKQLLGAGKWLAEHPEAIIPKSESKNRKCDFFKIEVKVKKIAEWKNESNTLRKLAKRGEHIVRAYAGTILQASTDKVPYLVVAKGPDGDIAYMFSPKVKREALIGLQYFKDPHLRLLAYSDLARKRKIDFYSVGDSVYCSPRNEKPPEAFIKESVNRLSLSKKDDARYTCGHNLDKIGYLEIFWRNASISLILCDDCLKDTNSLAKIAKYMLSPNLQEAFSLKAMVKLECNMKCDNCPAGKSYEFSHEDRNHYISGSLSDKKLYEKAVEKFIAALPDSGKIVFTVGTKCFSNDRESFAASIATSDLEKEALIVLLSELKGSINLSADTTANKFLSKHWEEFGQLIVRKLSGIEYGKEHLQLISGATPMSMIEKARSKKRAKEITGSLPSYKHLGKLSTFVDEIARKYKLEGKDAALKHATPSGSEHTRKKSIGLAFRMAMGESGMHWQYTKEEIDYARHLSSIAKVLLESEGEAYDSALRDFIANAGVDEQITRAQ